jgi:hypothetical protein
MQRLEVSGAVRLIYIYVVRRLRVKKLLAAHSSSWRLARKFCTKISPSDFYHCIRLIFVYKGSLFSTSPVNFCTSSTSGFGGLGVACRPLVPKFAGSNPTETVGFFRAKKKILSTTSFGGEVKPSVPCRRFAAFKRWNSLLSPKLPDVSRLISSTFLC